MNGFIFIASAATLAAYVCRLDALSWRIHRPAVIAAHMLPAVVCAFVMTEAAQGLGCWWHLAAIGAAAGWLVGTFRDWRNGPPGYAIERRARERFERARQ